MTDAGASDTAGAGRRCLLVFEPPDGGVADHVLRLALGLRAHGWVPVVAGPRRSAIDEPLRRAGVAHARMDLGRGYGRPWEEARAVGRLVRVLRRGRFDLVHGHSAKAGALSRVAGRLAGVPVVYTPNCFPFVGDRSPRARAAFAGLERALAPLTDVIVTVAEQEREVALAHGLGPPERLRVVRNATPACDPGAEIDPELQAFAAEGPLAGCLTVLRAQKRVDLLLRAAPLVLRRRPDARLAIIGEGPERERLQALHTELGLDARVRFFAFRPPPARQLAALDVFVLPSDWEALPIAILEAMACGVPQVATDVGGTAEALEHGTTGLLAPPGDPESLAERILALLDDPPRRAQMAAASRVRHAERFGVERLLAETAAVYAGVVAGRS